MTKPAMRRVAVSALKGLIYLYRYSFAFILGGQCRFEPSCSAYALQAVERHGPAKGSSLAFKRFCRCHPFEKLGGKHGFDPVPPAC